MNNKTINITITLTEDQSTLLQSLMTTRVSELCQEQVISFRNIIHSGMTYDASEVDNKLYDAAFKAVRLLTWPDIVRPMDQRSFPEFALEEIVDYLNNNEGVLVTEDLAIEVMEAYTIDGTMTYSTEKSLNYIHAFWGDFIDDDMEHWSMTEVSNKPELFLVNQTESMAMRVISAILDGKESMTGREFLEIAQTMEVLSLNDKVYGSL